MNAEQYAAMTRETTHRFRHCAMAAPVAGVVFAFVVACAPAFAGIERLIEAVPDDAVGAILTDSPRQKFPTSLIQPILDVTMPSRAVASSVADVIEHLSVPTLFGMYAPKPDGHRLDFFAFLDVGNRAFDSDQFVEKQVAALLQGTWKADGLPFDKLDVDKSGPVRRVIIRPGKDVLFAYAVRDKRVFASTRASDVLHWHGGKWPEHTWAKHKGIQRLVPMLSPDAAVTLLVNPDPLIRLIPRPEPNSSEDLLLRVLAPTDVKAAAGEFAWDKTGIRLKVLASLADPCRGVLGSIVGQGGTSTTLGILPEDFFVVGRIGFASGASIIDGLYHITDSFDPEISGEYRTEIAEFQNETGVNFTTDILGGLTGEAVIGVRLDFMKKPPIAWTVVCPLADPVRFNDSVARMEKHYGLKVDTLPMGETPVRFVKQGMPVAWGVHDKRLIIAESPLTVGEITKVDPATVSGEPRRATLRACRKALGGVEQFCVLADIEQFFVKAPMGAMVFGAGGTKLMRGTSAGISFATRKQVAELSFRWMKNAAGGRSKGDGDETIDESPFEMAELVTTLVEATGRARDTAKQTVVMANMRAIGTGLHMWAADHKNQFPSDLADLVRTGVVSLDVFADPHTGTGPANADEIATASFVIYRPGLSASSDPGEIVLAEKAVDGAPGASFLFVDGHVEFVPEPEAGALITKMKSGAVEVRR